jgi:chromosome segregation ATPase
MAPEEITGLIQWLNDCVVGGEKAAALEQQAARIKELEEALSEATSLHAGSVATLQARIAELEAERDRLQKWNELRAQDIITLGQKVGELEAEREEIKRAAVNQAERLRIAEEQRDALGNAGRMDLARIAELEAEADNLDERFTLGQARIKELAAERDAWKAASGSGQLTDLSEEARTRDDAFRAKTVETIKSRIDYRLNDCLCEMKEGYDDSIVGFNEAWDIVNKLFEEERTAIRALNQPKPSAETE